MFNFYKHYRAKISRTWNNLFWMKSIVTEESDLFTSFLNRRMLHRFVLKSNRQDDLNALTIHSENMASLLQVVHRAAELIPAGSVVIQGSVSHMTNSDWLNLELTLIKEQLQSKNVFKVSASALQSFRHFPTHIPAALRRHEPLEFQFFQSSFHVLLLLIQALSLPFFLLSKEIGWVIAGATNLALIAIQLTLMVSLSKYESGQFEQDARETVSSNWDDVFAMKSNEDAVLLGLIAGVIYHAQKRTPDTPIPDFLAMTPKQAMEVTLRMLTSSGYFEEQRCFEQIQQLYRASETSASNVVGGFDFSILTAEPDQSKSAQQSSFVKNDTLEQMPAER